MKQYMGLFLFLFLMAGFIFYPQISAADSNKIIVLDPGHGGKDSGAESIDGLSLEKDLNLKIAHFLKKDLESYEGVKVILTREEDQEIPLDDRSVIAKEAGADLLVSLHNNAYGGQPEYDHGAFVLASKGNYHRNLALEEQKLACNILYELSKTGLDIQGILLRESEEGELYPNGKIADYYRIIKHGIKNERKQIIIEHAYIDHDSDYHSFLENESSLKKLARADARGIARYYGLRHKEKGKKLKRLHDYKVNLVTFLKGNKTKTEEKIFYSGKGKSSKENSSDYPYYRKALELFDSEIEMNPLLREREMEINTLK